jgi:hypothetical protein
MQDLISRSFKVMGVSYALDTTEDKSIYCTLLNDTSSVTQTIYCNLLGLFYSRWNFIALQKSIHHS